MAFVTPRQTTQWKRQKLFISQPPKTILNPTGYKWHTLGNTRYFGKSHLHSVPSWALSIHSSIHGSWLLPLSVSRSLSSLGLSSVGKLYSQLKQLSDLHSFWFPSYHSLWAHSLHEPLFLSQFLLVACLASCSPLCTVSMSYVILLPFCLDKHTAKWSCSLLTSVLSYRFLFSERYSWRLYQSQHF